MDQGKSQNIIKIPYTNSGKGNPTVDACEV